MDTDDWPFFLSEAFFDGLAEYNAGEYFACHETLETLWRADARPVRQLYQGVIQLAVGCYHLTARTNWIGATRKLDEGARRLARILPCVPGGHQGYGVDWDTLIAAADRLRDHLRALGPERVAAYDPALLPTISFRRSPGE